MKRLIKYYSQYNKTTFSTCSTDYEVLPGLYQDSAGETELKQALLAHGIQRKKNAQIKTNENERRHEPEFFISHFVELAETKKKVKNWVSNEAEELPVYVGFIQLSSDTADNAIDAIDESVTPEQSYDWINDGWIGASNTAEIDSEYLLIMDGWEYYHRIRLAGYSLDSFREAAGIDDETFWDDILRCEECGAYNWKNNGYDCNFRTTPEDYFIGIKCGCFDEYAENNLDEYINDPDHAIESDAAERMLEAGGLCKVQTYVGGMTDADRSHSYAGEHAPIGNPEKILSDLLDKNPQGEFVFVHEESGQFQTYFTVYEVIESA